MIRLIFSLILIVSSTSAFAQNPGGYVKQGTSPWAISGTGAPGSAVPSTGMYNALNVVGTLRGWSGLSTGSIFPGAVAIVDASGNQITSFGGTSASVGLTGAAVPSSATYTGINVGGNLTGWTGAVTNAGTFAVQAAQSGTWSNRTQDGSGTAITSTASALDINIKSGNPTSIAVTQSTSPWVVSNGGTFAVQAAQSGNWATRTQDGSGNTITSTASALDVNIKSGFGTSIAVTQSTSPWIIAGGGTAGSAASGVATVQGIASMTPLLVNPGTAANWNTTWGGGTLGAMANYGTSPGAVLVPGVNAYVTNTVGVTGTFYQATQPVSIASAQVASGAYASGAFASGAISDGAQVTLGSKADAKSTATDATAVTVMSVLKEISAMEQAPASRAVTNAGTFAVQATITPSSSSSIGITPVVSASAESSHVLKAGAGNLYSVYAINQTSTSGYLVVLNATSAPADGAIAPLACTSIPANSTAFLNYSGGPPAVYSTGITAVVTSATSCFTKTTGIITAFISGSVQ